MYKILELLHGKKTVIVALLSLIITFLLKETMISENVAMLLNGVVLILGGGADVATAKLLGTSRK